MTKALGKVKEERERIREILYADDVEEDDGMGHLPFVLKSNLNKIQQQQEQIEEKKRKKR